MSADLILATLGAGGEAAMRLATIIQKLVVKAGELGELEIATYVRSTDRILRDDELEALSPEQLEPIRDHLVKVKRFPARWLDRIDDAIGRDLLWKYPDEEIVRIILMGPR